MPLTIAKLMQCGTCGFVLVKEFEVGPKDCPCLAKEALPDEASEAELMEFIDSLTGPSFD